MGRNPKKIAVSGTGGGVGQSIIKALAKTNYEVIALDGDTLGAGLYAAKKSYIIPYASSPDFIDRVTKICQQEHCALFFPGLDAELPIVSNAVERFKAMDTIAVVSSPDVIKVSDNKLTTFKSLRQIGVHVPETIDLFNTNPENISLKFPFILKKREGGARSKDVYLVKSQQELEALQKNGLDLSLFIAQEYIEGDEYTCGTVNFNGTCMGVIVMRRILRDGDTYKCFSVKNPIIEEEVRKLMTAIKPFGACNVQLRLKDGVPYIFEINARCSGTTAARALCGFNEPKMIADYLCHKIRPSYDITEQTILRYWQELVIPNKTIDKLMGARVLESPSHPNL